MMLGTGNWPFQLRKTQEYLRCRISGNGCDRDQIEAWRRFFRTQDPRIRSLVSNSDLPESKVDDCIEDVWVNVLAALPTLTAAQSEDSFVFWLHRVVRENVRQKQSKATPCASRKDPPSDSMGMVDSEQLPQAASMNDRLLYLRIIENQPLDRVARALKLTPEEVAGRQRMLLKNILAVLVRLDVMSVS